MKGYTNTMSDSPFVQLAEATESMIEAIPADAPEAELHPLVHGLDAISIVSAAAIGYVGVGVMMLGAVKAVYHYVQHIVRGDAHLAHIRIELGKHLALGLEFFVGKDIIESVVHPSWDDLGKLGVIVALRTILTVFLSRELKEVEEEIKVERLEARMERSKNKLKPA